jgi:hypothetical protein
MAELDILCDLTLRMVGSDLFGIPAWAVWIEMIPVFCLFEH